MTFNPDNPHEHVGLPKDYVQTHGTQRGANAVSRVLTEIRELIAHYKSQSRVTLITLSATNYALLRQYPIEAARAGVRLTTDGRALEFQGFTLKRGAGSP